MSTAAESEATYKSRLESATHHLELVNGALSMSDQAFQKAMVDIESMRAENRLIKDQLKLGQDNNELLAKRLGDRGNPLQDRVLELIKFCHKHGIDPDTGEKK